MGWVFLNIVFATANWTFYAEFGNWWSLAGGVASSLTAVCVAAMESP